MKSKYFLIGAVMAAGLGLLANIQSAAAATEQERRAYLQWMLSSLPGTPPGNGFESFEQWVKRTGELPPDFDALPRNNFMPDPLVFLDGRQVKSTADWAARRAEIKQLYQKWIVGSMPPKAKLFKATVLNEVKSSGYVTRSVELTYGPELSRTTTAAVTLVIPDGKGPFPVLMGGSTASLLRRGYIAVTYPQSVDTTLEVAALYPTYDFATMAQVSFITQTVVDYLLTVPEVDKARIALTGYSRTGRMAVLAAAMDDRIAAVIAGSAGIGGTTPWRLGGEYGSGEGIETYTRGFARHFPPRLRFFAGKEDRLPVDSNLLAALIAPRSILIQYGLNDEVANTWAVEQTYESALKVFSMLKQPGHIGLLRVPGFHGSNDVEAYLDWLDIQFGRSSAKWDNKRMFEYSRADWLKKSGEKIDLQKYPVKSNDNIVSGISTPTEWEHKAESVRASINWMLGDKPLSYVVAARGGGAGPPAAAVARNAAPAGSNPGQLAPDVPAWVISRGGTTYGWTEPGRSLAAQRPLNSFGYNGAGTIYYPNNTPVDAKLPVAIWLHGYSYSLGYMWVYRTDVHPILAMVNAGYAVLAYDQVGFGSRMKDFQNFYDRTPHWSIMGQMVEDVRKAVDVLSNDPALDAERISVFGYSIGGTVGLYAAALDPRIKSVVSVSGFTPMRTDKANRGLGGIGRYSDERGLLPRMGFFVGNEPRLPYDFQDVVAAIAPRHVMIVEPTMDRATAPAEVKKAVEEARKVFALYSAPSNLALYEPVDYTRLTNATETHAIEWMSKSQKPVPVPYAPAAPRAANP